MIMAKTKVLSLLGLLLTLIHCLPAHGQTKTSPSVPMISAGAPECPEHLGVRKYRSEVAGMGNASAYITGSATRDRLGCHRVARLDIVRNGLVKVYSLPDADAQAFSIVDFSPDSSSILLSYEEDDSASDTAHSGDHQVAVITESSDTIAWHNVSQIFKWRDCDATVEAEGFETDGSVILAVRPSIISAHPRPNCVSDTTLYSVNLLSQSATQLAADTRIKANGVVIGGPCQKCKNDPDLVGACFTVHGRMAMYNGGMTYHIWRVGSRRMLGVVEDSTVPYSLTSKLTWENAAFGDFYVCPFSTRKSGEMQFVCVEAVSNLRFKEY